MSAIPQLPPLEHGDHLSVAEFEHRYQAMPNVKKAELIEGVVYHAIAGLRMTCMPFLTSI